MVSEKNRNKSSVLGIQYELDNLNVNKVCNRVCQTRMKNQEKTKALQNGMDVVNVE